MRRRAALLALVLVAGACGGDGAPATTGPGLSAAAADYAASARRALESTRFESLGDEWLAGLVVAGCAEVDDGADPAAVVTAAVAGAAAPPGDPVDDEILGEVLTVGLDEVCPGSLVTAGERAAFLEAARPVVEGSGLAVADDDLVAAAADMCTTLADDPEQAVLGVFLNLFGAGAETVDDLAGVGAGEGAVVGAVLGAGTTYLCPEHGSTVQEYLDELAAQETEL
jgi:hypothetical protein